MTLGSIGPLAGVAMLSMMNIAVAHHSFAMFDNDHPIEISGVVKEFRYVNPHSVLVVAVKSLDGTAKDWILEVPPPGMLRRQGFSENSFRPGDAFKGKINPLHSGEPGGSYFPAQIDLTNPVRQ
jgi:Family of unknown function (DUF6152)